MGFFDFFSLKKNVLAKARRWAHNNAADGGIVTAVKFAGKSADRVCNCAGKEKKLAVVEISLRFRDGKSSQKSVLVCPTPSCNTVVENKGTAAKGAKGQGKPATAAKSAKGK